MGRPKNRIVEEGCVSRVLEEIGMMTHEDVDISRFDVLVGPDDGVVAHLDVGVGGISIFVNAGEDMDVWPR